MAGAINLDKVQSSINGGASSVGDAKSGFTSNKGNTTIIRGIDAKWLIIGGFAIFGLFLFAKMKKWL